MVHGYMIFKNFNFQNRIEDGAGPVRVISAICAPIGSWPTESSSTIEIRNFCSNLRKLRKILRPQQYAVSQMNINKPAMVQEIIARTSIQA